MSLSIGIVGLPNVGKSTIFNALTRQKVDSSNYPFCTIEPNIGCVKVPDERLDQLTKLSNSGKTIYSTIEFIDIAGLVKGAHKGEGLGNQFLANIRDCDAICHILRHFKKSDVIHVEGTVNPKSDLETINIELIMSDLQQVNKKLEKRDKELLPMIPLLQRLKSDLDKEILVKDQKFTQEEELFVKQFNFLTAKPCLYIFNVSEQDVVRTPEEILKDASLDLDPNKVILVCGKMEEELSELNEQESKDYLQNINISKTGLEKMIVAGYKLLDLISMLTTGEDETRAWTIRRGTKAPQAAGKIHTDFEKGFVRVEVIYWSDLIKIDGWTKAKEKGLLRMEGKEYEVKDGDVVVFHFSK
jgi:ribosome-binding ATPase